MGVGVTNGVGLSTAGMFGVSVRENDLPTFTPTTSAAIIARILTKINVFRGIGLFH